MSKCVICGKYTSSVSSGPDYCYSCLRHRFSSKLPYQRTVILERDIAALRARIAALEAELAAEREAHRWRKVSEELPESSGWYLGVLHIPAISENKVLKDIYFDGNLILWNTRDHIGLNVTHWQPLPAPPEEDE